MKLYNTLNILNGGVFVEDRPKNYLPLTNPFQFEILIPIDIWQKFRYGRGYPVQMYFSTIDGWNTRL